MMPGPNRAGLDLDRITNEHSAMHLLLPAGLAIAAVISLFARFHAGSGFLAFYEDDSFYYLRIAQQIAAGHHSTFDGTHLTNGYHPLWMLVLVALTLIFGTGLTFFYALQCVILLGILATYTVAARTLAVLAPPPAGCRNCSRRRSPPPH